MHRVEGRLRPEKVWRSSVTCEEDGSAIVGGVLELEIVSASLGEAFMGTCASAMFEKVMKIDSKCRICFEAKSDVRPSRLKMEITGPCALGDTLRLGKPL